MIMGSCSFWLSFTCSRQFHWPWSSFSVTAASEILNWKFVCFAQHVPAGYSSYQLLILHTNRTQDTYGMKKRICPFHPFRLIPAMLIQPTFILQQAWEKKILKSLNSMCTELNIPLARKVSPNSACTELSTPLEQGEGGRREGRWGASLNSRCSVLNVA